MVFTILSIDYMTPLLRRIMRRHGSLIKPLKCNTALARISKEMPRNDVNGSQGNSLRSVQTEMWR